MSHVSAHDDAVVPGNWTDAHAPNAEPSPRPERVKRRVRTDPRLNGAQLLERIRAGDAEAMGILYDRYERFVLGVLSNLLGADHELADALQETFIRAMKGLRKVEEPNAIPGWLARMATYVARDLLRSRRRRRWLRLFPTEALAEQPGPAPDEAGQALLRRMYILLDKLPDDERIAFLLRFGCEFDLTEVASYCDCSLATVKRRLARAKAHFSELAEGDPELRRRMASGDRWGGNES